MKQITFTPRFEIGQDIYHKTPDSDKGIIIDIIYSILTGLITYSIAFGRNGSDQVDCFEHELSEDKIF